MSRTPADILRESAALFDEKNLEHGNTFQNIGKHLVMLFPEGLVLKTAEDFNVFYNFIQLFSKLGRMASCIFNPEKLKHESITDSPTDAQCYAAMLQKCIEDLHNIKSDVMPHKWAGCHGKEVLML